MIASSRVTCFWPGLAAAWCRGNSTALSLAILSMWSLCFLILATFVWPQWVSTWALRGLWLLAIAAWIVSTVRSNWQFTRLIQVAKPLAAKDNFLLAQDDYLAGNWFEAEAKLLQILHEYPRDAESQLLLVGVLRRTKRFRPALRRLAALESLDSGARWRYEIRQERAVIERRMAEVDEDSAENESVVETEVPAVEAVPGLSDK